MDTKQRANAKNDFGKDSFKRMNKHIYIKLVTTDERRY